MDLLLTYTHLIVYELFCHMAGQHALLQSSQSCIHRLHSADRVPVVVAPWFFFKISALYKSFTYLLTYCHGHVLTSVLVGKCCSLDSTLLTSRST